MNKINCFQCKHFHTTWNPHFPRGCKAYGFKTKEMPSVYVKQATGMECLQFEPKNGMNRQKQENSHSQFDIRL